MFDLDFYHGLQTPLYLKLSKKTNDKLIFYNSVELMLSFKLLFFIKKGKKLDFIL